MPLNNIMVIRCTNCYSIQNLKSRITQLNLNECILHLLWKCEVDLGPAGTLPQEHCKQMIAHVKVCPIKVEELYRFGRPIYTDGFCQITHK